MSSNRVEDEKEVNENEVPRQDLVITNDIHDKLKNEINLDTKTKYNMSYLLEDY